MLELRVLRVCIAAFNNIQICELHGLETPRYAFGMEQARFGIGVGEVDEGTLWPVRNSIELKPCFEVSGLRVVLGEAAVFDVNGELGIGSGFDVAAPHRACMAAGLLGLVEIVGLCVGIFWELSSSRGDVAADTFDGRHFDGGFSFGKTRQCREISSRVHVGGLCIAFGRGFRIAEVITTQDRVFPGRKHLIAMHVV